jgi:hypothetical protein
LVDRANLTEITIRTRNGDWWSSANIRSLLQQARLGVETTRAAL